MLRRWQLDKLSSLQTSPLVEPPPPPLPPLHLRCGRNRGAPSSGVCCSRSAASQRRRLSPVRVKVRSASGSGGFGTFPPPLLHLVCRHEAETEEAAAVRRAGRSCPSFPPQCRAVVFVSGPSVRQLARPSGRSGQHSASSGKDLGQFGGAGSSFLCCYKEREF